MCLSNELTYITKLPLIADYICIKTIDLTFTFKQVVFYCVRLCWFRENKIYTNTLHVPSVLILVFVDTNSVYYGLKSV